MKVQITDESKKVLTVALIPAAKLIIKSEKEDSFTAADYAEIAARLLCREDDSLREVLSARAEIAKNCRVWNAYGDSETSTEELDVWIDFTAETWNGFIRAGAYLSDIWEVGPDDMRETLRSRMYCRYAKYE